MKKKGESKEEDADPLTALKLGQLFARHQDEVHDAIREMDVRQAQDRARAFDIVVTNHFSSKGRRR